MVMSEPYFNGLVLVPRRGPTGQAKKFMALWRDANGLRHRKRFAILADAKKFEARMRAGTRLTQLSVQLGEGIAQARELGGRRETRRLLEQCVEIISRLAGGKKPSSAVELDAGGIDSQRRIAFAGL